MILAFTRTSGVALREEKPIPRSRSAGESRLIVTGTSVLGLKFKGGVILAADTLGTFRFLCQFLRVKPCSFSDVCCFPSGLICIGSYGGLAKFRSISRLKAVGDHTVVGGSGDLADFAQICKMLDALVCVQTGVGGGTSHMKRYLSGCAVACLCA